MTWILAKDIYKYCPEIELSFFSRASMVAVGDAVLAALAEDGTLAPQRIGDVEPLRIPFPSPEANSFWRQAAQQPFNYPAGTRKRPCPISLIGRMGLGPNCPFHDLHWSAEPKVLDLPNALARIEALFRRLAVAFQSYYAYATHNAEFERQNVLRDFYDPQRKETIPWRSVGNKPEKAIPGVYWLNYFGPEYTRFIGADRLRALDPPAEPLGEGMLLKLAPSPLDMIAPGGPAPDLVAPGALERSESIRRRLGEDLFFDIRDRDRKTRAPTVPLPPPIPMPELATNIPRIPDAPAFIAGAAERAAAWRRKNDLPVPGKPTFDNARATLRLLAKELDAGLPDIRPEEVLADATAVLGQLILDRIGGRWEVDEDGEPYLITARGEAVHPVLRILKHALDADAQFYSWYRGLVTGTLPPPLKPEQSGA